MARLEGADFGIDFNGNFEGDFEGGFGCADASALAAKRQLAAHVKRCGPLGVRRRRRVRRGARVQRSACACAYTPARLTPLRIRNFRSCLQVGA